MQLDQSRRGERREYIRVLIISADPHDIVGVDVGSSLGLGNVTRRRDVLGLELAEEVFILGKRAFSFEDLGQDGGH
jgi:hypothetical protein